MTKFVLVANKFKKENQIFENVLVTERIRSLRCIGDRPLS